jgi:hypothetical protein
LLAGHFVFPGCGFTKQEDIHAVELIKTVAAYPGWSKFGQPVLGFDLHPDVGPGHDDSAIKRSGIQQSTFDKPVGRHDARDGHQARHAGQAHRLVTAAIDPLEQPVAVRRV